MTVDLILPLSGAPPTLRPEPAPAPPSTSAGATVTIEPALPGATQTPPSLQSIISAGFSVPTPGSGTVDARTISLATEAAAISQGDLALLMADLVQALKNSGFPASVQAAVDQVLSSCLPLNAQPSVADIKAALVQSGLLTPAQPASAALPNAAVPATAPVISSSGNLKGALLDLQQALGTWLDGAAAATPLPGSSGTSPGSPAAVPLGNAVTPQADNSSLASRPVAAPASLLLNASEPLAQASPSTGTPPSAATINAAAVPAPPLPNASSLALVLPTGISAVPVPVLPPSANAVPISAAAQQTTSPPSAATQALAAELPIAIAPTAVPVAETPAILAATVAPDAALRLASPIAGPSSDGAPAIAPAADQVANDIAVLAQQMSAVPPAIVDLKQAVTVFEQLFKAWFDSTQADSSPAESLSTAADGTVRLESPSAMPRGASPAISTPSFDRSGPAGAPPSMPPTNSANADPVAAINRLMRETNAALTHQDLLGIASLPADPPGVARGDGPISQWMFEIPFATPQGCAVAQFKISRDGPKGKKGKQAPVWRAHFSLDVEPMGPVHAQIALSGERTWISLWAEREESVARLRDHEALLTKSLIDSELIAEIAIHAGVPRQTAPIAGRFLDHQS